MKTLGEQAAEKIIEHVGDSQLTKDSGEALAEIIDTLHTQQQPCGCEKLREALELIDREAPVSFGGKRCSDPNCWPCKMWQIAHDALLAQPCQQPASVGSEEGFEHYCAVFGITDNEVKDHMRRGWNAALRRQSVPTIQPEIALELRDAREVIADLERKLADAENVIKVKDDALTKIEAQLSAPVEAWRELGPKVIEYLKQAKNLPVVNLNDELHLDSLDLIRLFSFLDSVGFHYPDEALEAENVESLATIKAMVEKYEQRRCVAPKP